MPFNIGNGDANYLSGTSGKDAIAGRAGVDILYGGDGNDAFVIRLSDMDASLSANSSLAGQSQDFIYDFYGAGVYQAGNNDFLYLADFGVGSTLTFIGYGQNSTKPDGDIHAHFYSIHSTVTGLDYVLAVGSMNGNQLILGDYNFYN